MNIIVLLGKSGSGKDAMQNLLINYLNDFEIVKLTSTRPMRENEKQGDPYFFTIAFTTFLVWLITLKTTGFLGMSPISSLKIKVPLGSLPEKRWGKYFDFLPSD